MPTVRRLPGPRRLERLIELECVQLHIAPPSHTAGQPHNQGAIAKKVGGKTVMMTERSLPSKMEKYKGASMHASIAGKKVAVGKIGFASSDTSVAQQFVAGDPVTLKNGEGGTEDFVITKVQPGGWMQVKGAKGKEYWIDPVFQKQVISGHLGAPMVAPAEGPIKAAPKDAGGSSIAPAPQSPKVQAYLSGKNVPPEKSDALTNPTTLSPSHVADDLVEKVNAGLPMYNLTPAQREQVADRQVERLSAAGLKVNDKYSLQVMAKSGDDLDEMSRRLEKSGISRASIRVQPSGRIYPEGTIFGGPKENQSHHSWDEAKVKMQDHWGSPSAGGPAVKKYTEDSNALNAALGGWWNEAESGPLTSAQKDAYEKRAVALDNAISKAPKIAGITYRGMRPSMKGTQSGPELVAKYQAMAKSGGSIDQPKNFTSTSVDSGIADRFDGGEHGIVFRVAGRSGVRVKERSKYPHENEVLFRRGTKFKVNSMTPKEIRLVNGKATPHGWNVDLIEVGS